MLSLAFGAHRVSANGTFEFFYIVRVQNNTVVIASCLRAIDEFLARLHYKYFIKSLPLINQILLSELVIDE